jgi:hypothetical protein
MSAEVKECTEASNAHNHDKTPVKKHNHQHSEHKNSDYKSPISIRKRQCSDEQEGKRKQHLDSSVSPLSKSLFNHERKVARFHQDTNRMLALSSPQMNNKILISISPDQNDSFSGFQKDDFQLKNSSERKNSKMIEFPYPDTLLSKSNSSKKISLKKLIKNTEIDDEGSLKRRLFEKESNYYEMEDHSNVNILGYNDHMGYVENLITPPPKTTRRIQQVPTDQKQSGIKYLQNDVLEQYAAMDPYYGQMGPQINYKYKRPSYPCLIPFCNKCNLPIIFRPYPPPEYDQMDVDQSSSSLSSEEVSMSSPERSQRETKKEQRTINKSLVKSKKVNHYQKMEAYKSKKSSIDENGKKIIRRRKRKSYEQLQMLVKEFQANPEWSKDNMLEVSRKTGLSEAQVYKGGWDQRRKMLDPSHDIHEELRMYK